MVREGQALLVNTARGVVGVETATLVGATLLGTLAVTLEEQARLHPNDRRRVLLVVDEFQTLLGVDYGAMLSELRKFGGTFALATQALAHLDALDPTLRPTVLANVDALYAFATSAEDAHVLAHELDDAVEVTDLINQDDYTCYAKLTLDGRRLPVFSLVLDPPPRGEMEMAERLHALARMRYARPVEEVDDLLAEAAARYTPPHEVRQGKEIGQSLEAEQQTQVATTAPAEIGVRDDTAPVSKSGRGRRGWRPRPSQQEIAAAEGLWAGLMTAHPGEQQVLVAGPPDHQETDQLPPVSLRPEEPADLSLQDDADGTDDDRETTYE
ncbi:MAG: type IV secretion system DNA-binding domain-containing protein [Ktedonobacterales bacterium]